MVVSSVMKLIITRTLVAKTDADDGVQIATVEVSDYYSHLWVRDLNETMLEVISAVYDDDTTPPNVSLRPADDAQTTVYDFTD